MGRVRSGRWIGRSDAWGAHVRIPSSFHDLGLKEWSACFPNGTWAVGERAKERLSRKGGDLPPAVSLEELCLPKNVAVFELAHDKLGELWVSVHANRPNRTLLVGDAFFVWRIRGGLSATMMRMAAGMRKKTL